MAFPVEFRSPLAALIFTGFAIPNLADNAATSPITDIWIGLHTGDPSGGNQTTSESGYTSYARVAIERTTSGYTEGDGECVNDAEVAFPTATGGSETLTHVSCGTASSGTGALIIAGALNNATAVSTGIRPRFAAGSLVVAVA